MPNPVVCCCGCDIAVCFAPSCIDPAHIGVPLDECSVTVSKGGSIVATCTLEPGDNCVSLAEAGSYSFVVQRGGESSSGTFEVECGDEKTVYVTLFTGGYTARVWVVGCFDAPAPGIVVTYDDGQNVVTGTSALVSGGLTAMATWANLPVPVGAIYTPVVVRVTIAAQCGFAAKTVEATVYPWCGNAIDVTVELEAAAGRGCSDCCWAPWRETLTFAGGGATGPITLTRCYYYDDGHPAWNGCGTWTYGGTVYPCQVVYACGSVTVYVNLDDDPGPCPTCPPDWDGQFLVYSSTGSSTTCGCVPDESSSGTFAGGVGAWSVV